MKGLTLYIITMILGVFFVLTILLIFGKTRQNHPKTVQETFQTTSKIPLIMYRTGPFPKNKIPSNIQLTIDQSCQNLGVRYKYYSNEDCLKLIKNNFRPKTLKAYQKLIPTAYKADFFRYCVLYLYGGIYSDLSQKILFPYNINEHSDDMILVKDRNTKISKNNIQISFMATIPRNPFLISLINQLTDDILASRKGLSPIDVTGPTYFGRFFCHFFKVDEIKIGLNTYFDNNGKKYQINIPFFQKGSKLLISIDGRKFIERKVIDHINLVYNGFNRNHYNYQWHDNNIFNHGIN